jgi:hypothetical protein
MNRKKNINNNDNKLVNEEGRWPQQHVVVLAVFEAIATTIPVSERPEWI